MSENKNQINYEIAMTLTDIGEPRDKDESKLIHFSQILRQNSFDMF